MGVRPPKDVARARSRPLHGRTGRHLHGAEHAAAALYPPIQSGDQGISPTERAHAEAAIARVLRSAGVQMVATYWQQDGTYELRSATGSIRYRRHRTGDGGLRFEIVAQQGDNPVPSTDPRALDSLSAERAAAGGAAKAVPHERTSYPDILRRVAQIFDGRDAPDFAVIPTPSGNAIQAVGEHGSPNIIQSRAPLIFAGPGVPRGATLDAVARVEDLAPTLAQMLGVTQVRGIGPDGTARTQFLKWQDGDSLAPAVAAAGAGAAQLAPGRPERGLLLMLDGMSFNVFNEELAAGRLPNLARIASRGTTVKGGSISQFPSLTWPNHNTALTGAAPGHNGIVNNSWYNRATQTVTEPDGGFLQVFRNGRHLSPDVETLYEAVARTYGPGTRTYAGNQPSGRGASTSTLDLVGLGELVAGIGSFAKGIWAGIQLLAVPGVKDPHKYKITDNIAVSGMLSLIAQGKTPKFASLDLSLADGESHEWGPQHATSRAALQAVDRNLGRILDALEKAGQLDSMLIAVSSDHGQETQSKAEPHNGWEAAVAAAGVAAKHHSRYVYMRTMQVTASVAGSSVTVAAVDDDTDERGTHRPMAGATVVVKDSAGRELARGVAGPDGRVSLPLPAGAPADLRGVSVEVSQEGMTTERVGLASNPAVRRKRNR